MFDRALRFKALNQTGTAGATGSEDRSQRRNRAGAGFVLGLLTWLAAAQLGIGGLPGFRLIEESLVGVILFSIATAGIMTTRARIGVWVVSSLICALFLVIAGTPLSAIAVRSLVRADPLQPSDAVYVLGTGILSNGKLPHVFQNRVLQAYEVLQQGHATRLVVPRLQPPHRAYLPEVRRQMKLFGIAASVQEITPVANTYDEAIAVARLARRQKWQRIILVTSPSHTRRAAAVFRKTGLTIIASPCTEGGYDLDAIKTPADRLTAFRDWAREYVGYQLYQLRGRI